MTPRIIVLLVLVVLAVPGAASAKGPIHSVEACGADRCKEITAAFDVERYRHSLFGSTSWARRPRDAGYYRMVVNYSDGSGGPIEGWEFLFAPAARAVLEQPDGTGSQPWITLKAARSTELERPLWDLRPFPASSLRATVLGEQPRPHVAEVAQPAAHGSSATEAIAGFATLLALVTAGAGLLRLRRTRARRVSATGAG